MSKGRKSKVAASRNDRARMTRTAPALVLAPARGRGQDGDVVAALLLSLCQSVDVCLDTAEDRQVVVGEVQNPHLAGPSGVRR